MSEDERFWSVEAARVNAGLTQADASERLGITRNKLANYENGRTPVPLYIAWKMKDVYRLRSITQLKP